jgi:glycosyltransferase involved in cell wall biosynthesis
MADIEVPSMTRVLMVLPQYPYPVVGGLERQAHELSLALKASGTDLKVVSGRVKNAQPDVEDVGGIPVHRLPWSDRRWIRFVRMPFSIFSAMFRLRASYDVVHLHQHSWFSLYAILIAKLLRKPVLTKLPNVGRLGIPGVRAERLGSLKLKILFASDALIAMSDQSLQELRTEGYPAERVLAVPNGINLAHCASSAAAMPVEAKGDIRRVVFVGRVAVEKRVDLLIEQWAKVQRDCPGAAVLEIWGDGPLRTTLQRKCGDLGLSASVVWRGHVEGVRDKLPAMHIFVLPSVAEGNSNAILEAMAAGLPVLSTPVGGTPMMLGPEAINLMFNLDDDSLGEALIRLIRDDPRRKAVGVQMRARVVEHFDIRRVARVYANAYQLLAARKASEMHRLAQPVVLGAL